MKFDIDEARKQYLCEQEVFCRNVARVMAERRMSADELAARCPSIPLDYLKEVEQGQAPYPMRPGWGDLIVHALGFCENRGRAKPFSDEECYILVQPKSPWHNEIPSSSPEQGSLL